LSGRPLGIPASKALLLNNALDFFTGLDYLIIKLTIKSDNSGFIDIEVSLALSISAIFHSAAGVVIYS